MSATDLYLLHANAVPLTADGRVLHLELRSGEVANNIVTVGSEGRGEILASLLDGTTTTAAGTPKDDNNDNINDHDNNTKNGSSSTTTTTTRRSKRGFVTHTGTYNGVPVSIVLINMGYPNMDFFVREVRAVTTGPLRIVRLGSCAGLRPDLPVGSVAVASEGSVMIRQNPDAWEGTAARGETQGEPYLFHGVAPADEELSEALLKELKRSLDGKAGGSDGGGGTAVVGCLNASADSFYSSQGRLDPSFEDRNSDILSSLLERHPSAGSFEMETFQLLHLARLCRKSKVQASAATIVLANRIADDAIAIDRISRIERAAGEAALRAVTSFGDP
ncbi:conserved unknown protein [Ectocarpus siliculosus]|uniref:Nucleoside phosphorylase domain-containing protein n=1 Tax=Ectocarpus siliculosus TaxID=2880 RepID=D7FS17_ECTSI|nr:conserved unknown protein [Ectocarpus siliculosus]|eukprot:CBJ30958.1 conserved unknown protein [Ectocarpus siliculosus]